MSTPAQRRQRAPILILYTGGTIGMTLGAEGWQPAAGFDVQIRAAQMAHFQAPVLPWIYLALEPPIDSANMRPSHWLAMRDVIVQTVESGDCSGVVVLHGTDTLAYTASALSFLLLDLPVAVAVTGSMQPASVAGTDAWTNLFGAVRWIRTAPPGAVAVVFGGKVLPGVRATKRFSHRHAAFVAMREGGSTPPLSGMAEGGGQRAEQQTMAQRAQIDYRVARTTVPLAVLPLYPGIDAHVLQALLATDVRGVVLELYGSGTGPADDAHFVEVLRAAHVRGVVWVGVSQCPSGSVDSAQYAAANRLAQAGLIPSGSMTREAALGKLFALLGAGLSVDQVRAWWQQDLCGEWWGSDPVRLSADLP